MYDCGKDSNSNNVIMIMSLNTLTYNCSFAIYPVIESVRELCLKFIDKSGLSVYENFACQSTSP